MADYGLRPNPLYGSTYTSTFRRQHLPALVLAGLQVDMVGAAMLAGIVVLDVGRSVERVSERRVPRFMRLTFLRGTAIDMRFR